MTPTHRTFAAYILCRNVLDGPISEAAAALATLAPAKRERGHRQPTKQPGQLLRPGRQGPHPAPSAQPGLGRNAMPLRAKISLIGSPVTALITTEAN